MAPPAVRSSVFTDGFMSCMSRTTNLPSTANFSGCCWFRFRSSIPNFAQIVSFQASYSIRWILSVDNAGQVCLRNTATPVVLLASPIADTWYFAAWQGRGNGTTDVTGWVSTPGGGKLTEVVSTTAFDTSGLANMQVGFGYDGGEQFFGDVALLKVWDDSTLKIGDFFAEQFSPIVVRRQKLNTFLPMQGGPQDCGRDYSGQPGRDFQVAAGTVHIGDPPPVVVPRKHRRANYMLGAGAGGSTTFLSMAGAYSDDRAGAPALTGQASYAGLFGGELPGAGLVLGALAQSGALLYDAYGAPVSTGTLAPAGARAETTSGAPALTGTLAPAGGATGEAPGASGWIQTLLMAGGLSEERYGAPLASVVAQMSGAQTAELGGVVSMLATLAQAGATSEERGGAITLLQTILLLMAGASSQERGGASAMSATLSQAGGPMASDAGAAAAAGAFAQAGARNDERVGAATVLAAFQQAGGPGAEAGGSPALAAVLAMVGALSGQQGGTAQLLNGLTSLLMAGYPGAEVGGSPLLALATQMAGARSAETGGTHALTGTLAAAGARGEDLFGAIVLSTVITLAMSGLPGSERGGAATTSQTSQMTGFAQQQFFGAIQAAGLGHFAGGVSDEEFGAILLLSLGVLNLPLAFLGGPPLDVRFESSELDVVVQPSELTMTNCSFCLAGQCGADFHLVAGDRGPSLLATLYKADGKTPQDLTGATVVMRMQLFDGSGAVVDLPCTPLAGTAVSPNIQHDWLTETDTAGLYSIAFKATFPGPLPVTWPNFGEWKKLRIKPAMVDAPADDA
jgi:hypothetical protein